MKIEFRNVSHIYNQKSILPQDGIKNIDLDLVSGGIIAVIGPTGSGKSTFIQHLNGLLLPTEGHIHIIDEEDLVPINREGKFLQGKRKQEAIAQKDQRFRFVPQQFTITSKKRKNENLHDLRKKIGVVFQFPEQQLFESSVEKDVSFGPRNYKIKNDEALKLAHQALESVNISPDYFSRSPFDLSGGEQRKVAIAGILALKPEILVLDEPTAGLDSRNSADIMQLITSLKAQNKTIILVTHDMKIALNYSDKIMVFKDGEVTNFSRTRDILEEIEEVDFLEKPKQLEFSLALKKMGFEINLHSALDFESLVEQIERGVKKQ